MLKELLSKGYLDTGKRLHLKNIFIMIIDTHCHLYHKKLDYDIHDVLARALEAGLSDIMMPAIDRESAALMAQLPNIDGLKLHTMAGIHPCDVHESPLLTEGELIQWAKDVQAIAIGETGLDYYWSKEFVDLQKQSLLIHFNVAKKLQLPVVLHNRNSTEDFLEMLESAQDGRLKGVWHCFNGSIEEGKRVIDAGFYLGLGGVITFKNGGMDSVVPHLDPSRFVLETDSPFLAPKPNRGKRNEPAYTALVRDRLAELLGMQNEEVNKLTTENARTLFSI